VRVNAICAKPPPHTKAEIRNAFSVRHVDQKRPEPLRGNVVIHILERGIGQARLLKPTLNGSANIGKELRERPHDGYPV
jgi:hypothetical protein